jgi:hypothetical protein
MSQDGGEIKPAVDVGELGWLVLGDDVSSLRDISMMKSISVEDEIRSLRLQLNFLGFKLPPRYLTANSHAILSVMNICT